MSDDDIDDDFGSDFDDDDDIDIENMTTRGKKTTTTPNYSTLTKGTVSKSNKSYSDSSDDFDDFDEEDNMDRQSHDTSEQQPTLPNHDEDDIYGSMASIHTEESTTAFEFQKSDQIKSTITQTTVKEPLEFESLDGLQRYEVPDSSSDEESEDDGEYNRNISTSVDKGKAEFETIHDLQTFVYEGSSSEDEDESEEPPVVQVKEKPSPSPKSQHENTKINTVTEPSITPSQPVIVDNRLNEVHTGRNDTGFETLEGMQTFTYDGFSESESESESEASQPELTNPIVPENTHGNIMGIDFSQLKKSSLQSPSDHTQRREPTSKNNLAEQIHSQHQQAIPARRENNARSYTPHSYQRSQEIRFPPPHIYQDDQFTGTRHQEPLLDETEMYERDYRPYYANKNPSTSEKPATQHRTAVHEHLRDEALLGVIMKLYQSKCLTLNNKEKAPRKGGVISNNLGYSRERALYHTQFDQKIQRNNYITTDETLHPLTSRTRYREKEAWSGSLHPRSPPTMFKSDVSSARDIQPLDCESLEWGIRDELSSKRSFVAPHRHLRQEPQQEQEPRVSLGAILAQDLVFQVEANLFHVTGDIRLTRNSSLVREHIELVLNEMLRDSYIQNILVKRVANRMLINTRTTTCMSE